ncbi:MAG: hypothetical protein PWP08_1851 [Methanofollis sp.]|nr:hypothetical protein [Methanofollis sp.]
MISVLLIDDDPMILDVTSLYLQREGEFSVTTCEGASGALHILENKSFDAIISDYEMPDMNGIEFLKVVRARGDTSPFIIFTGRGREDVVIEALNNGANFYLQKGGDPKIQFAELKNMIRQAVQNTRAEAALRVSETRYRVVVESQTELISRFLPDGTQVFVNEAFCRYYGLSSADLIGKRFFSNVPKEDELLLGKYFRSLTPENPVGSIEHRIVLETGEIRWQQWVDRAIFDGDNVPVEYQSVGRDTTDRMRAEEALRDSENKFKVLSEQSPVGIYILHDGRFTYVNPGFAEIFGYTVEEISAGMPLLAIVHPEDRACVGNKLDEREMGSNGTYEFRGVRKDGRIIMTEVHGSATMIGGVRVIIGTMLDITERKQMEVDLKEKVNYVQALMDAIPAPVFYRDTRGIYRDCNRAFEELTGRSREEIIGREIHDFFPREYADVYREKDDLIIENPHIQRYEFAITDRDGRRLDVLFSKTALFTAAGAVAGIVGVIMDISERKRMEQTIRENEVKYRTIADFTYDWEAWLGPDGNYFYVSPSCERITGYPAGDFMDHPLLRIQIAHPDDRELVERHYCDSLHDNEGVSHIDYRIVTKQGEVRWISHYCQPVFREDGTYMGRRENKRDITERKRVEEALKLANEKLNLLSNITRHDVLNRLTGLLGYLEFVREFDLEPGVIAFVEKAEESATVIRHQISFTRDYQDIGVHSPAWQNVRRLVWSASMTTLPHSGIAVENRIDGVLVYADPLFEKVFTNIIDNAVRHGGPVSRIEFSLRTNGDSLIIVCEDDGRGVEEGDKEKIFRRGVGKNTGYGLFLAREILAITGLSIREVGTPGQGARFEITAPDGTYRMENEERPGEEWRSRGGVSPRASRNASPLPPSPPDDHNSPGTR